MKPTYSVSSLWRYPVKSMAGEELDAVRVTPRGLRGDRAYALVNTVTGKVGSAKSVRRFGDLLNCRAEFVRPPESDDRMPAVRITLPAGAVIESGEPGAVAKLHAAFGPQLSLVTTAPAGLMLEFAATLARLQAAYPDGQLTVERFRPNIVVDCPDETGFVENSWTGRTLTIGSEVVLRVSIPCPRCVMTTLPRADLPLDPRIPRTIDEQNRLELGDFGHLPCVGV